MTLVGTRIEVRIDDVAHGGHCVGRWDGRVVFVRHTWPGERVVAIITDGKGEDRFLRADAVEILDAVPERVDPPCSAAGPGGCGGCDFQHVELSAQRAGKARIVTEQLRRLGGVDVAPVCEPVAGDVDGLRYRTRARFAADSQGRLGMRAHRSHDVVPLDDCLIAVDRVRSSGVLESAWPGKDTIAVTTPDGSDVGPTVIATTQKRSQVIEGPPVVEERVPGSRFAWSVQADGFWQVHRGAPAALIAAVLDAADIRSGDRVLDLFCGAGLFTLPLADAVGGAGLVVGVESERRAVDDARHNAADMSHVRIDHARADRWCRSNDAQALDPDVVVLDPPRKGAGRVLLDSVVALAPRRIVYVACDPAALGRDTGLLAERGWRLAGLRVFDLFPMTHHIECVAVFLPVDDA